MAEIKDFDLDVEVKSTTDESITPNVTSVIACTIGCITGVFMTCMSNGC